MKLWRIGTCTLCKVSIFYYLFNLGWYSVQLHILSISWLLSRGGVDGRGGYIFNRQNPVLSSMMKVICHCWRPLLTISVNFLNLIFSFFSFLSFFFFLVFMFRIILFRFVICCINRNLYFLAQQRTGNLLKVMGSISAKIQTRDIGFTVQNIDFPY